MRKGPPGGRRLSRRSFLEIGSLALGGVCLSDVLRHRAFAAGGEASIRSDRSVILIWMQGGPSHIDTYDPKPGAHLEFRGEFSAIPTAVPGLEICELLPEHAKVADKFVIIRSLAHNFVQHGGATGRVLTGYDPGVPDHIAIHPEIGAVVSRLRQNPHSKIPPFVSSINPLYGGGSAYLGETCSPFAVVEDPNSPDFKIKNISLDAALTGRLDDRLALLHGFDSFRRELETDATMASIDAFNQQALSLLTSDRAKEAFDLSQESPQTREAYGRHEWGQRALLARRLVEAGCSFVTVQMQDPKVGKSTDWDDHAVNWNCFVEQRLRIPLFDRAVAALIEDLYQRGLDKQVMIIAMGEFGRSPRIENKEGRPGRDHWPNAMSALVSGGGIPTGQVIGSTTSNAEVPRDRPLSPNDLLATVYHFLGVNTQHRLSSARATPILPSGEPIRELI